MGRRQVYSGTSRFVWRQRMETMLSFLFPTPSPLCLLCYRMLPPEIEELYNERTHAISQVCPFCFQEMKKVSLRIHKRMLVARKRDFETKTMTKIPFPVVGAVKYDRFVRASIRAWKYDGTVELTAWFGHLLNEVLNKSSVTSHLDAIIPAPTSRDRVRKRGYDQAKLLAALVSKHTSVPLVEVLQKASDANAFTQSQTARTASERRSSATPIVCHSDALVRNKVCLLVDDVVTTGTTLQKAAEALLTAGANRVYGLVLAHVD